jgi:hypothetical protein
MSSRCARALLFCIWIWLAVPPLAAQQPRVTRPPVDNPQRVLFVGNSYFYYNNSLHNHVRRLVAAADPPLGQKLAYKSATIGGAILAHHDIEYLTRPGRIGVAQPFELVILQGASHEPLAEPQRARFRQTVIEFAKTIAARGGATALYMTHAYAAPHPQADARNLRLTEDLYVSTGNEIGALVIPVGLAFEEAYRRRPDIRLHHDDGSHPSALGTYLAACTVFASVYGRSPVGNPYDDGGRIDRDTAAFLQRVADDTVKKFFGR